MALKPHIFLILGSCVLSGFLMWPGSVHSQEQNGNGKKVELEKQIEQLENEAKEIDDKLQQTQNETRTLANETKTVDNEIKRRELEIKRLTLAVRKAELQMQEKTKNTWVLTQKIGKKKKEKEELLRLTKGKEALFQQLLKSKKRDITTLKTQLFYLEKTGITAEDAIRFADLAAKRAGIRTAFLLALLEVETGRQFEEGVISVGTNLGTVNWRDDLYLCYQR